MFRILKEVPEKYVQPYFRLPLAVLFYAGMYFYFTWPLILDFSSHVPGKEGSDVYVFLWNAFIAKVHFWDFLTLETGQIFAPHGISLQSHTLSPLFGLFNLLFVNTALGVNTFLALNFVLSALGGFLLCRRYVSNNWLCLLVGFVFAFSPFKTARLIEHYNLVFTAAVPFYMLFFIRGFKYKENQGIKIRSWRDVGLCFFMGILTLLSDPILAALLFFFTIFYGVWQLLPAPREFGMKQFAWVVVLLIACHFLIELLKNVSNSNGAFWWGADFLNLVVPWHHLSLASQLPDYLITEVHQRGIENVTFLGLTLVGLLIAAFVFRKKRPLSPEIRALLAVGIVFALLTIPQFKMGGEVLFNNPFSILHFIPGLNQFRCPGRFIMPAYLLLTIPVFYKLEQLSFQRFYPFLFLLFLLEYSPVRMATINTKAVPDVYQKVENSKGDVLLPLPFGIRDGFKEMGEMRVEDMWYQSVHQKSLIGGYISRVPERVWDFYQQDSVMQALLKIQSDTSANIPDFSDEKINRFFNTYRPEIVVVAPDYKETKAAKLVKKVSKGRIKERGKVGDYLLIFLEDNR